MEKKPNKKKPKRVAHAKEKLFPVPRHALDKVRQQAMKTRVDAMAQLKQGHDESVKELYHLEMFQNMLDYNPSAFINDVRYNKVHFKKKNF